jgi:hypothetical protein
MRKSVFVTMIATAMLTLACDQTFARVVHLSGTHGKDELKAACGSHYNEDPSGYGCSTNCHGGAGKQGTVGCTNNGKCTGEVPLRGRPSGALGAILHAPSSGLKSSEGNAPSKGRRRPVNASVLKPPSGVKKNGGNTPPTTIMRSDEHHSGGGRHR